MHRKVWGYTSDAASSFSSRLLSAQLRIPAGELRKHFQALDVQNATASSKDDERVIKDTIKEKVGFDVVNKKVCQEGKQPGTKKQPKRKFRGAGCSADIGADVRWVHA